MNGAKHYGDETLDSMPLNNPEQFYSPHVIHSSDTRPSSSMRFSDLSRRDEKVHKLKNASSSTSVVSTAAKPSGRPRGRPPSHGARESSHSESPSLAVKQAPAAEKGIKPTPKTTVAERQISSSSEDSFTEEERDAFVARWYKYREDKGDPCNKAPALGKQDVDLYRMYRAVKSMGGFNKVNKANSWARVMHIMHVSGTSGATPTLLKNCYKRFMADFELFVRQFGWSMSGGERRIPMDEQRQRSSSGKTAFAHKSADAATIKHVVGGRKSEEITKDKKSKRDDTLEPIGANRSRKRSVSTAPSSIDSVGDKRDGTVGPDASMFVGTVRVNEAQTPSGARCVVGQRVRAQCKTQWYEARIVLIECYNANTNVDNKKMPTPPPLPIVARVRVHYHGWKARFDEWVTPDGLKIDGNMETVDQPTDHPPSEYKSRFMSNRNRSTSISSTGPSSMRGESTKRVDGASTRHQHKVATVAKKSKRDEKTVKMMENDDTDSTDTSSTVANNHMIVKAEAPKDAVKPNVSRKRQTSISLEPDTSKRGRSSVKDSSKSVVKLTPKSTADLKQEAAIVDMKTNDSDEHADEESEEDDDDDDDDETQVEARVTRSRAAADPIKRKWSRSNILILEEAEDAKEQSAHESPAQHSDAVAESTKTAHTRTRRTTVVEKYEGEANGEMAGTKSIHTLNLPEIDVVLPATDSAADSNVDCGRATDGDVDEEIEFSNSHRNGSRMAGNNNIKSQITRARTNNGQTGLLKPTHQTNVRGGGHRGVKVAVDAVVDSKTSIRNGSNDNTETTSEKEQTVAGQTAHHTSPAKADTLAALKQRVLAKLLQENHDFQQDCERVVKLDANLTDDESIDLIKKRMERVRKVHSCQRSKLQKIEKRIKALGSTNATSNNSLTALNRLDSSHSSTATPSSTPVHTLETH